MARVAFFVFSNGGDMERASTRPVRKLNKSFWQGVRITPVQRDKLVKLAGSMGKSVTVSDAIRNLIDSANIDIRGGHGA